MLIKKERKEALDDNFALRSIENYFADLAWELARKYINRYARIWFYIELYGSSEMLYDY